jgi:polyisoprenoid-binding protein YceI
MKIKHCRSVSLALVCAVLAVACTATPGTVPATGTATSATTSASTAWSIDPSQSNLTFVTTKAGQPGIAAIAEVQSFKRYSGGLDRTGQISLSIDLASVDTGFEIRDERLRTLLWDVKVTPRANFVAKLSPESLGKLAAAGVAELDVDGQLELAAQTKPVQAKLRMTRVGTDKLMVVTRAPIVINSADFGLGKGVEALRDVMGLGFVSASAPVSFALLLNARP